MEGVCVKLFSCHVCLNHRRKAHESRGFVLASFTPSVSLSASLRAVGSRLGWALSVSQYDGKGSYIPLVGLRPRLPESPYAGESAKLPFCESPLSSPPNRRRLPRGMLFDPVMP
jgi:hypothetical protein